ncbi:MAG: chemotaxis protein CheW [Pleurocapsa sp.]
MNQEYFSVTLSSNINLAVPLENMGTVIQIETKNICMIPGVANFWHGTVNFKGSLLWVLDSDSYFNLNNKQKRHQKKLTAIIIKPHQSENLAKIALITSKLQGIISVASENLTQLPNDSKSPLQQCCSTMIEQETKRTFILNPTSLLEQLHQQSAFVPG